jgi:hypothetical protein
MLSDLKEWTFQDLKYLNIRILNLLRISNFVLRILSYLYFSMAFLNPGIEF